MFIPFSIGAQSVEIHQETRKLYSNVKWHIFMAHSVDQHSGNVMLTLNGLRSDLSSGPSDRYVSRGAVRLWL